MSHSTPRADNHSYAALDWSHHAVRVLADGKRTVQNGALGSDSRTPLQSVLRYLPVIGVPMLVVIVTSAVAARLIDPDIRDVAALVLLASSPLALLVPMVSLVMWRWGRSGGILCATLSTAVLVLEIVLSFGPMYYQVLGKPIVGCLLMPSLGFGVTAIAVGVSVLLLSVGRSRP